MPTSWRRCIPICIRISRIDLTKRVSRLCRRTTSLRVTVVRRRYLKMICGRRSNFLIELSLRDSIFNCTEFGTISTFSMTGSLSSCNVFKWNHCPISMYLSPLILLLYYEYYCHCSFHVERRGRTVWIENLPTVPMIIGKNARKWYGECLERKLLAWL